MLGDTGVAVHPDDERYAALVKVGAKVKLPLVGREIPIIADDYSDPEKGTGAVKITPAHDFNDFEVGKRHDLPQITFSTPSARSPTTRRKLIASSTASRRARKSSPTSTRWACSKRSSRPDIPFRMVIARASSSSRG